MPEPMTILEQVNAFKRSNRQHLIIDRTFRRPPPPPVYSSFNHIDNENIELKTLSVDVYASKHLVNKNKSTLSPSERNRLGKLLLPSMDKTDEIHHRRRKKKRPSYHKSLYHPHSPHSTETDLTQINARGMKPELHVVIPVCPDDDTVISFQRDHVPPPSPSDDELDRLINDLQDRALSPSPSPVEKEGYVPFRLPTLRQSARFRRTPIRLPVKDIRSTLSNYLRRYY